MTPVKIYNIAERRNYTPNLASTDYESSFLNSGMPLVIDNGQYKYLYFFEYGRFEL